MAGSRSTPSPHRRPSHGRLNSLGFSRGELDRFLDELEALAKQSRPPSPRPKAGAPATGAAARRYVRRELRLACVPLRVHRAGGDSPIFPVACRNISCTGVSVLHSAYIHTSTRCTLFLPSSTGEGGVAVNGVVVRCRHVRGMAHEIGIRFDAPLDLREVIQMDCLGDWFSLERVDPTELSGPVLCVAHAEADRQLVRTLLADTSLAVVTVDSAQQGMERALAGAPEPFLTVICAHDPPALDAPAFVEQLRARGCPLPAVVILAQRTTELRARIAPLTDVAAVCKPLEAPSLHRALAEFLIMQSAQRAA